MEGKNAAWAPGLELMGHLRADGFRVEVSGVDETGRRSGIATYIRGGAVVDTREAVEVDDGVRPAWFVRQEVGDAISSNVSLREALRMKKG